MLRVEAGLRIRLLVAEKELVRIALAAGCGLAGLLLGGPAVAVVSVAILPFLVATFRLLTGPAYAVAPSADAR